MRVPSADELAAIAAAYLVVTGSDEANARARDETSRWRLAGRLPCEDADAVRAAARSVSRWKIAGRLDG